MFFRRFNLCQTLDPTVYELALRDISLFMPNLALQPPEGRKVKPADLGEFRKITTFEGKTQNWNEHPVCIFAGACISHQLCHHERRPAPVLHGRLLYHQVNQQRIYMCLIRIIP